MQSSINIEILIQFRCLAAGSSLEDMWWKYWLYLLVEQLPSEGYGNFRRENYNITAVSVGAPGSW